jgi:molybdenum cofactor cytidylyltransferase
MGRTKQLLKLGDKTVIMHCLDALLAAGINNIVAVLGMAENGIAASLDGLPLSIAINGSLDSDMAESVRTGLMRLSPSSAVLVFPSDHPLVAPGTIAVLVHEHGAFPDSIIIPAYGGRRGHPSLFPRKIIDEIFSSLTLRDIVRRDPARVRIIPVRDEGVILDMDTPADYNVILKKHAQQA